MTPERWKQIDDIFQQAADMPPSDRDAFLDTVCGNDADLLNEVKKLLLASDSADDFIEASVWTDDRFLNTSSKKDISDSLGGSDDDQLSEPRFPETVGAFRLVKELGRGGMGAVYLAERNDGEFSQLAAIKLIKRGMDSDFIVRRFRHERRYWRRSSIRTSHGFWTAARPPTARRISLWNTSRANRFTDIVTKGNWIFPPA